MTNLTMHASPLYDSVIHEGHNHWCDLEINSLATCEARAMYEHTLKWTGDVLSFAALAVLLLLLLRPFARALVRGDPGELVLVIPARRFAACAFIPEART